MATFVDSDNRKWKLDEFRQKLPEEEVKEIAYIHIPMHVKEDYFFAF